jgi:hypothetical protein
LCPQPHRRFYDEFAGSSFSKNKDKYVKFAPETVKAMLEDLFEGRA